MDLKLKVLHGTNAGQEVAITGHRFLIGRAEDCHLRPGSEMISRHHCVIVVDQLYVAVRDFGSKNGTYVNNERVIGECELKSGDQLRVGPLEFEITLLQGELGGAKRPPVQNAKQAAERTAAGQPEEHDISQWLTDRVSPAPNVDSRRLAAFETQSIKLSETEQIAIARPPSVAAPHLTPAASPHAPQPATTQSSAVQPGPVSAANAPRRAPPATFQMPDPLEPLSAPEEKGGRSDPKKVFGKLPVQQKRPEDTRSAASDLLDKLRKRR